MITELQPGDAAPAAALSAQFGWPHRPADWTAFLRMGHGVGWREDGRLAGTAMWFPLGPSHAAIGLVQVAPGLQGRGIGRTLMQAVMAGAHPRSLVLHATAEGAGLYASLGFSPGEAVEQWQGIVGQVPAPGPDVWRASESDRAAILRLDQAATGLDRSAVLGVCMTGARAMLGGPRDTATGYAVRRAFGRGLLIGPVVAAEAATAEALLYGLAQLGFLRVDVPAGQMTAALSQLGLRYVGSVHAMRTGVWPTPSGPTKRFGLLSQALG